MKAENLESKSQKREHGLVVDKLRRDFVRVGFQLERFNREEALIAIRHIKGQTKPHIYVAHEPDFILSTKEGHRENRIVIEYVHSARNFLFDLRGMIALSAVMKEVRKFLLVINDDVHHQYQLTGVVHKEGKVLMMSLKKLREGFNETGMLYLTTL